MLNADTIPRLPSSDMSTADYICRKVAAEERDREARDPDLLYQRQRELAKHRMRAIVAHCAANLPFAEEDDGALTVSLESDERCPEPHDNWWYDAARLLAALGAGSVEVVLDDGKRYRIECREVNRG